jgi:hypothetical protein
VTLAYYAESHDLLLFIKAHDTYKSTISIDFGCCWISNPDHYIISASFPIYLEYHIPKYDNNRMLSTICTIFQLMCTKFNQLQFLNLEISTIFTKTDQLRDFGVCSSISWLVKRQLSIFSCPNRCYRSMSCPRRYECSHQTGNEWYFRPPLCTLAKLSQSVVNTWMMRDDKSPSHRSGFEPNDLQSNALSLHHDDQPHQTGTNWTESVVVNNHYLSP